MTLKNDWKLKKPSPCEKEKHLHLGASKNRGTPKWMVKIMENPIKMDDLGIPLFSEKPISVFEHVRFFGGVLRLT